MALFVIKVPCFPTEDPSRVMKAILNIFPESEIEESETGFVARSDSAERLKELIRNSRILDAARGVMIRGRQGNRTTFRLHKQAAYAGKISFLEEEVPLGTIEVTIESSDIDAVIDDIAPKTIDGEIP